MSANVEEVRERIAAEVAQRVWHVAALPGPQDRECADRILAAVASLFTEEDTGACVLGAAMCRNREEAYLGGVLDALSTKLAALRALAQPKEGSNG